MTEFLPINWHLIGNPVNWVVILLMVLIAGFALHLILPSVFPENSISINK